MKNKFQGQDLVIHVKTNTTYMILEVPNDTVKLEYCNEPYYRYILENYLDKGGALEVWIRCKSEMEDGRFTKKDGGI